MSTLATALFAIVLLLVGGGIGFYLARLGQTASAARCDEIQQEYDAYRTEVADHFGKTAEQFHAIGLQYRELYEHLATGSAKLCELEAPGGGVPFPPAIEAQEAVAEAPESEPETEAVADEAEVAEADMPPADFVAESGDEALPAEEPEQPAEEVVAEEEEPTPDNVVELVPRADEDDKADKQTYS